MQTSFNISPHCHDSCSQSLRKNAAQTGEAKPESKPSGVSKILAKQSRRPPLPPQDEAYRQGQVKLFPPEQKAKVMPVEEYGPRSSKQGGTSVCTENKKRDMVLHGGDETVEQEEAAGSSSESQAQRTRIVKECQSENNDDDSGLQPEQRGQRWPRHRRNSPGNETSDDSRKRPGRESWQTAGPRMPKWKRS
jgi:hypothetical protein